MSLNPIFDIIIRLTLAVLVGGLIGLNRELRRKAAGLRTHSLVALGAAVVTALATQGLDFAGVQHVDAMSRAIQGIITGIGFLGAGVIMRSERGKTVHGLTTAASIWLAACLGAASGAGAWEITSCAFVLVMLILIFGGPLERWVVKTFRKPSAVEDEDQDNIAG